MSEDVKKYDERLKGFTVDCTKFVEKKNNLSYLSWANAYAEMKKLYPDLSYRILKNPNMDMLPAFGNDSIGFICYTEVTILGITHEMWLPVMDFRNKAMMSPTAMEINKTVMRCLTKNLAMFGLGINIYQGEDFPNSDDVDRPKKEGGVSATTSLLELKKAARALPKEVAVLELKKYNDANGRNISKIEMLPKSALVAILSKKI